MLPHHDLGASLYKTWTDEQKLEEIKHLVEGFRKGLPVGILCKMAETIMGSPESAGEVLRTYLTRKEQECAVASAEGGMKLLLENLLLTEH